MKTILLSAIAVVLMGLSSCSGEAGNFIVENEEILPVKSYGNVSSRKILDGFFIQSIAFDKSGSVWIGTFKQGLIKYNEQEIKHFNFSNSPFTNEMVINSIATDSNDNLWIGSNGLIKYDGENFSLYNSTNSPIPEDYIHSINTDHQNNLWFSSSRFRLGGIVKFDGKSKWSVFTPDNSEMPGNLISSIAIRGNDVWAGVNDYVNNVFLVKLTDDKVKCYSGKQLGFTPYYLGNLCMDNNNTLYILNDFMLSSTIYNDDPHLFAFDGKSAKAITCPHGALNRMYIDSKDNIWCVSRNAEDILIYTKVEWLAVSVFPEDDKGNTIFCIKEAPDGKIWIGTGNGIYIIDAL